MRVCTCRHSRDRPPKTPFPKRFDPVSPKRALILPIIPASSRLQTPRPPPALLLGEYLGLPPPDPSYPPCLPPSPSRAPALGTAHIPAPAVPGPPVESRSRPIQTHSPVPHPSMHGACAYRYHAARPTPLPAHCHPPNWFAFAVAGPNPPQQPAPIPSRERIVCLPTLRLAWDVTTTNPLAPPPLSFVREGSAALGSLFGFFWGCCGPDNNEGVATTAVPCPGPACPVAAAARRIPSEITGTQCKTKTERPPPPLLADAVWDVPPTPSAATTYCRSHRCTRGRGPSAREWGAPDLESTAVRFRDESIKQWCLG